MADKIIRTAVKGVASGIGLVSEGIHHHKERKKVKGTVTEVKPEDDDGQPGEVKQNGPALEEGDEEHWDLDEAQNHLLGVQSKAEEEQVSKRDQINPTKVTDAFIRRHPPPSAASTTLPQEGAETEPEQRAQLPLPVILPQRRPKDRARGFIRAYAPDLMIKDVDQETFLDFIETFNTASLASPWLDAINLAGFATMALPPGISQAVQLAIMVSVKIAKDIQSRKRQNTFLDRINDDFFQPRGLYCLVLTWQPDSLEMHTSIDVTSTIAQRETSVHGVDKVKRSMKSSSAAGDIEFTECASLVFPALDELAVEQGPEADSKRAKLKHYKSFSDIYFDRRAQAKHAGKNPDSTLAKLSGPAPKFTSRYADPNHPASSGNLWSLLTGGKFNPPNLIEVMGAVRGGMDGGYGRGFGGGGFGGVVGARRQMMMGGRYGGGYQDPYQQGYHQGYGYQQQNNMPPPPGYQNQNVYYGQPQMGRRAGMGGPVGLDSLVGAILGHGLGAGPNVVKRLIKKNVLYLMIVNMPTDQEMEAANHYAAAAKHEDEKKE